MGEKILEVLWRAHFIDNNVKTALRGILSQNNANIIRLVRRKTQGIGPSEIRESLKRANIQIDFPVMPKINRKGATKQPRMSQSRDSKPSVLAKLIENKLIQPPLSLETEYKGKRLTATIQADGTVFFNGKQYDSLSTAAGMARVLLTKPPPGRKYPQTNGWTFWKYQDPEAGRLCCVDMLRKRL